MFVLSPLCLSHTVWSTNPYYSIWLSPTHQSGWIATVMFFSYNVGSAIVMLITALLFTLVTALMALVLLKVSQHKTLQAHTHSFHVDPRTDALGTISFSFFLFSSPWLCFFSPHVAGAQTVPRRWWEFAACSGGVEHRGVEERTREGSGVQCCGSDGPGPEPAPVPDCSAQLSRQQPLVIARRRL